MYTEKTYEKYILNADKQNNRKPNSERCPNINKNVCQRTTTELRCRWPVLPLTNLAP